MNTNTNLDMLLVRLEAAVQARCAALFPDFAGAMRLFNGFYEGYPDLIVDLYAATLLLYDYALASAGGESLLPAVQAFLLERLPWVKCVITKQRSSVDSALRRGAISFGGPPDEKIQEHGVWYALDLCMNQDASFYLDTALLRGWLLENAAGWQVLNAFAYTGSLGVAALAGGAARVVQVDRSRKFLDLARRSGMLNRLDIGRMKLQAADFFSQAAVYKRQGQLFDCVILDPPFFSATEKGTVDLVNESMRLVNKARPLIKDGGRLAAINNALFLSGADYSLSLERLCQDGYLEIETIIPVPAEITGYPNTILTPPPADPAPFNHPTKIAILRVRTARR